MVTDAHTARHAPRLAFAGCVAVALVSACASEPAFARVPDNVLRKRDEITQVERKTYFPNRAVKLVYQAQQWNDGRERRHGKEIEYDESGCKIAERFYREGQPIGNWKRWWPDGTLRMELTYRGADAPTPMSWWHENGVLAERGPARDALRDGVWSSWSESGVLLEQGAYERGRREGHWRFWRADGTLREEGVYASNRRVGAWIDYDRDV